MAQTFEGNSSALLSTECCYFQSNAISTRWHVCNALVKHLRFCICVQYCCPDAFENSQSLHYWCLFTCPLQNRNRKPQANNYLANSGTDTIFNLPLAGQLGSWPMNNIWPEEGCDLLLCSMYEAYKIYAGHWQDPINEQSFASKPHRLCPTDKKKCACHVTTNPKMPKKHHTVHRGRGSWGNVKTGTVIDMCSSNGRAAVEAFLGICPVAKKKKA